MSMTDVCVTCDHIASRHIYGEGACRPGFPCPDKCEAFVGPKVGPLETRLLAQLEEAEQANPHADACKMCTALSEMSDQVKAATERALAGTIGRDKLVTILAQNGYPVGRRSLERHRQEGHTS